MATRPQFEEKVQIADGANTANLVNTTGDSYVTSTNGIPTLGYGYIFNNTQWDRLRSVQHLPASGYSGLGILGNSPLFFNGTNYDAVFNNTQGTLLASGARTASIQAPTQTNYNARGVIVFINVTAVSGTSPTLSLQFQGIDPVSGNIVAIGGATSNITATGLYVYWLYPTSFANLSGNIGFVSAALPRAWSVYSGISGTTPSFTYSLGYQLIL